MKKFHFALVALLPFLLFSLIGNAQIDTATIVTSSLCSTCKKTIEHEMSFEKGVKSSDLDIETRVLTIIYEAKKTNLEKLRIAVTKIGYDADSLKADPKAFNKLPDCCKDPDLHH